MKWVHRVLAALALLVVGLAGMAYWSALRGERPVGFQISRAADTDGTPFAVGVWYPTDARPWPTTLIGSTLMDVARDAPVAGRDLPLVVISHGNGGGLQSHADLALALASAGYVVAAPDFYYRAQGERVFLIDGVPMSMDDCPVRDVLDSVGGKWTSLMILGLAGYRNAGPWTIARNYRDLLSAAIMINNDRILGNTSNLLLVHKQDTSLIG